MALQKKENDHLSPKKRNGSFEAIFKSSPLSNNNDEGIHEPKDFREWTLPVPFSALTQTMRPNMRHHSHVRQSPSSVSSENAEQNGLPEESAECEPGHGKLLRSVCQPSCITDEFGFKIDLTSEETNIVSNYGALAANPNVDTNYKSSSGFSSTEIDGPPIVDLVASAVPNTEKTGVTYHPATAIYSEYIVNVHGSRLMPLVEFAHLGSTISENINIQKN
ncbi:unnamed protein product [Schistocephalus solidus]|uniref:Uncharacterized protein n=1 Tax=Schistocephalus solidus TaxID=70667 RepID=A0A183TAB8_SCHSO|nr:unnamed protein product [Schistocephalus solidus]